MQAIKAFECTHLAVKNDVPHQIWEGISSLSESGLPIWVIRLINNKVRYYGVSYAQCYVHYWSPKFWLHWLQPLGFLVLLVSLVFIWYRLKWLRKPLLILAAVFPLIMIFELYRL